MITRIEIDNCYHLDCLDSMRLMKEQGLKADWCITDPPYGISYNDMTGGEIMLQDVEIIPIKTGIKKG